MDRPYEPLFMTSAMWMSVQPMLVRLDKLIATNDVYEDALKLKENSPLASWSGDPFVHVIEYEGKFYVADGNHRVENAKRQGQSHLPARVLRELA